MIRDEQWFGHPDDARDDDEYYDEDDSDDEVSETLPCPECGADVYEDAEQCPYCGAYITFGTNVWSRQPTWWIVLGLLGVVVTVLVLALGQL